jgi:hypothetical protein
MTHLTNVALALRAEELLELALQHNTAQHKKTSGSDHSSPLDRRWGRELRAHHYVEERATLGLAQRHREAARDRAAHLTRGW